MRLKRLSLVTLISLVIGLSLALTLSLGAAPADLEPGGKVIPLGKPQADMR
jgi:hypothetical protein